MRVAGSTVTGLGLRPKVKISKAILPRGSMYLIIRYLGFG